jgi:hypothetical protein
MSIPKVVTFLRQGCVLPPRRRSVATHDLGFEPKLGWARGHSSSLGVLPAVPDIWVSPATLYPSETPTVYNCRCNEK